MIYDTECNSLDVLGGFVQEIAWAVYNVSLTGEMLFPARHNWRCIKSHSSLVSWGKVYPVEPEAFAVTGLSSHFSEEHGRLSQLVFHDFMDDVQKVDFLCGHNAIAYDKPMMISNLKRAETFSAVGDIFFDKKPHIDTLLDCPYPASMKQMALKYLALDHGYVLSGAHEAMNDVFACAHILKQYDLNKVIEISKTPVIKLGVRCDFNDSETRQRISNLKMYWNKPLKRYEKTIREYWLPEVQLKLGVDESQMEVIRG